MRGIVHVLFLVAILFASCAEERAGLYCALPESATIAPAHRTDRERHMQLADTIMHWGQFEFYFPTFFSGWSDWMGPICGGVVYYDNMIPLPALPDSTGSLVFDDTEFTDTSFGGLTHCWSRDNVVMPMEKDVIRHTIWNKGTLPILIDSVRDADNRSTKVFCHQLQLMPGDSATIWFTTESMHAGWNAYQLKLYYTNLLHYPHSGRTSVQVFELLTYYIEYGQLE